MNRFLKYLSVLFLGVLFAQCKKDDPVATIPITPYSEQYPIDNAAIEKFMKDYYMEVDAEQNVTFFKMPNPNPTNIKSIWEQTDYPIKQVPFTSNDFNYMVYYINISKKVGNAYDPAYVGENLQPTRVDSVFVTYKGRLLDNTQFDQATNPVWFPLQNLVPGWSAIVPEFKTGQFTPNADGTVLYSNYGAGIMFLPSGLGYYDLSRSTIPSYSPLIFNFKLMHLNYIDHDGDKVDSKDEDLNHNGIFTDDDTDGDGRQNYLDKDDDGDSVLTKYEVAGDCDGDGVPNYLDKDCTQRIP